MTAILEAIMALLQAIPYFDKWFTKTPEQQVEEGAQAIHDRLEKEKETGRPTP